MSESDDVLGLAIELARRAGTIQRDRYETEIQIETKSSAIDLVTRLIDLYPDRFALREPGQTREKDR